MTIYRERISVPNYKALSLLLDQILLVAFGQKLKKSKEKTKILPYIGVFKKNEAILVNNMMTDLNLYALLHTF